MVGPVHVAMIEQATETQPPEVTEPAVTERHEQLRELASQSWNLELVISGAALYATLSLPELLDSALNYYRYNLMLNNDYFHDILPIQVIGLSKGACYVLFAAFLVNFIMRAFWVGLVGLLAVYPDGIKYDQIYNLSKYAQKEYARRMGRLSDYAIRLDQRCNVIFALAFMLTITLLGVAFLYCILVVSVTLIQWLLSPTAYATFERIATPILLGFFVVYMIMMLVMNLPKFRDNPRLAPASFKLTQASSLMFLGLYRPAVYILFTFYSQIPKAILQRRLLTFTLFFTGVLIVSMVIEITQHSGAVSAFDGRSFITFRDPGRTADANSFDNLRPASELIKKASIQSDVIREPYIRLFIAYPKMLDAELNKRFIEPAWSDTLTKEEKRKERASWYLQTFAKYFQVAMNDSVYQQPEYLFTQRPDNDQRGLTTVLPAENLPVGKNVLKITVPDSANKPKMYYQIPFWYIPEK